MSRLQVSALQTFIADASADPQTIRRSIYQDTAMHTEEEFVELAGEEDKTEAALSDPHAMMLARLRFELKERQR